MNKLPRKILLVSKFQTFQGGVEKHIQDLTAGLRNKGYEVDFFGSEDVEAAGGTVFRRDAQGVSGKLASARSALWNSSARSLLKDQVERFQPDLIHYHSIYHQLSPSVLGVFSGPTVMTLHDYKLAAPCYTLYRDGEVCRECVGSEIALPSLKHGCIGNSVVQGSMCIAESMLFRRRYEQNINRFIVPSQFVRGVMIDAGLPDEKLAVVPWGLEVGPSGARSQVQRSKPKVVFAGRLHVSKGIEPVLEAWQRARLGAVADLVIAGSGELQEEVLSAAVSDASISYLGMLTPSAASELIADADLILITTLAPETMGLTALEAILRGVPILTSGRGALADLAGHGVTELGSMDAGEIANQLTKLLSPGQLEAQRAALAGRDLSMYTLDAMLERILTEYETAGLERSV